MTVRGFPSTPLRVKPGGAAKGQSGSQRNEELDCFCLRALRASADAVVARAPRNDGLRRFPIDLAPSIAERSDAIQEPRNEELDCFVARAPRNDGEGFPSTSPRQCERSRLEQSRSRLKRRSRIASSQRAPRKDGEGVSIDLAPVIASEAKQSRSSEQELDCFVARAPRNDGETVRRPPCSACCRRTHWTRPVELLSLPLLHCT